MRGFDLARNPGLNNTTEYGAGEFPLPTKPTAGTGTQNSSKVLSMIQSQQTEESYPDLSNLKWELERIQRERDQANLDRDQANHDRNKVILERDLLNVERDQAQKLQQSAANCDQVKSEVERLQRKQQELASGTERKVKTLTESLMTRSRPDFRMEVDETFRSAGRFNLDRVAQEQMNEGLNTWMPPKPVPSSRDLESGRIKTLMDIKLLGLSPRSTSGSQAGAGTSRLKELQKRLQARTPESPAREVEARTWREYPMRSSMFANYKKNTDGAYHRHKRDDWTSGQRERRDEFHDASCVQYFTQPRISEGTVYLIIGDSLVRVLTRIQAPWQVGTLSFWGAAMPQILASLEMLEMGKVYTVTLMMGTKNASKGESRKMVRLQDKENCFLEELRIYLEPTVLTICTFPYNRMADQKAMNMNERVRHFNDIIRQMQKRSLLPVRLLHVARMMEYSLPLNSSSDGIHFNKPKGAGWLNGTFQGHINNVESDLVETNQFTLGPPPRPSFFSGRPVADPLGGRIDSRGSSRSSRIWQLGSTPMERDEVESSTPQSSGVSQVPMVEKK